MSYIHSLWGEDTRLEGRVFVGRGRERRSGGGEKVGGEGVRREGGVSARGTERARARGEGRHVFVI